MVRQLPMSGLRRAMRSVLAHHLGARSLKSWEMLGDLARVTPPVQESQPADTPDATPDGRTG